MIAPRQDVALMAGYHSPQLSVKVRLNTNEAPWPPPDGFAERLAERVRTIEWHRYPERGAPRLREAIATHHEVDPSMVFAANGSNEVLQTVLLSYGGPGRSAAVFEPTYALHSHIARLTGTAVLDGDDPLAGGPDIVFLCSPNNPTGEVADERRLLELLDESRLLVVDEAYAQFSHWSAIPYVAAGTPLVVVRTFSKTWSMAAARLGYCITAPEIVDALDKVVLPYHLDAVKQIAGELALEYADEMRARVAALVEERGRLVAGLSDLDVEVFPSGANFVLIRPRKRDAREVWDGLVERSVLVRDCSSWPRLEGCLRVTVGTPEEDDAFLSALAEVLA